MSIRGLFGVLFLAVIALAIVAALAIGALIARTPSAGDATATYGAEQFHIQLTAQP